MLQVAKIKNSILSSLFIKRKRFSFRITPTFRFLLHKNRQILYIASFWKLMYTCCRVAEHMYIIFQVLRFAQNLQRCARLSLFCRLSFCAPEPRDIALHVVCCMETLYVSLRDSNKQNVFEPHSSPCAFVHTPKQTAVVHSLQDLPLGKSWRFAR